MVFVLSLKVTSLFFNIFTVQCDIFPNIQSTFFAQSAGAVEYTDCTSGYDTKQSDGEVLVMLKLWGMQSTPLLPSLPCPLWPGVVAPDRALSIG